MKKRNKAIFAGTSNTIGLGLELEFSKRFQDDDYLKSCKNIPPIEDEKSGYDSYLSEDIETHRKYRWPKLVCDYFNLEEFNINDPIKEITHTTLSRTNHAVNLIFSLFDISDDLEIKNLLNQTKYIFLEFGYIRWWDDSLHGVQSGFKWPSTPAEIDRFLKDKDVDFDDKNKAIEWLNNINPLELWERTLGKIKNMKEKFPKIQFILLSWGVNPDVFNHPLTMEMIDYFVEMKESKNNEYIKYDIGNFLDYHKLTIRDTVKAYNPKYKDKWLYEDYHANSKGHQIIANQIIKKLLNETRGLYSI